jgi:hypothetical protein
VATKTFCDTCGEEIFLTGAFSERHTLRTERQDRRSSHTDLCRTDVCGPCLEAVRTFIGTLKEVRQNGG